MVFDPIVNFLQGHVSVILAVDSKLDHCHVGIRGSLGQRVLLLLWTFGQLNEEERNKQFYKMSFLKKQIIRGITIH